MEDMFRFHMLNTARLCSCMSPDPWSKVGATVFDGEAIIHGYNDFPEHLKNHPKMTTDRAFKNEFVIHAEINALRNVKQARMIAIYPYRPCGNCLNRIIECGIKHIITLPQVERTPGAGDNIYEVAEANGITFHFLEI